MNSLGLMQCLVPLFCAVCFLRVAADRRRLDHKLKEALKSRFEVRYGECPGKAENRVANQAMIHMLRTAERYSECVLWSLVSCWAGSMR